MIENRYLCRISCKCQIGDCWDYLTQTRLAEDFLNQISNPGEDYLIGKMCFMGEMLHYDFGIVVRNMKQELSADMHFRHPEDGFFIPRWQWRFDRFIDHKELNLTIPFTVFCKFTKSTFDL